MTFISNHLNNSPLLHPYNIRMDEKLGRILEIIAKGKDLTKLAIKELSSYSMTTVIKGVDKLVKMGFITCLSRNVKCGKPPSVININIDSFALVVIDNNNSFHIAKINLDGSVIEEMDVDNIFTCDELLSKLAGFSKSSPSFIYILSERVLDFSTLSNYFSCEIRVEGYLLALSRIYTEELNKKVGVLLIGEEIRFCANGEKGYNIGALPSPIISVERGRLTLSDVLSFKPYISAVACTTENNKCFFVAITDLLQYIFLLSKVDKIVLIREKHDCRLDGMEVLENCSIIPIPDSKTIAIKGCLLTLYGK